jgi:hypothetical protein
MDEFQLEAALDKRMVGNLTWYTEDASDRVCKSELDYWGKAKRLWADKLVGMYKVANCLVVLGSWLLSRWQANYFGFYTSWNAEIIINNQSCSRHQNETDENKKEKKPLLTGHA